MIMHTDWLTVGLIDTAIRIIGLIYAAHAIMTVRTSQGAVGWVIGLIAFPYAALPLYWVFGRRHFHGYADAQKQASQKADLRLHAHNLTQLKSSHPKLSRALLPFEQNAEKLSGFHFTDGNDVKLLINGMATFTAICNAIEEAQHYIVLQFFIIKNDKIGQVLLYHLLKKAEEGVQIYVLYDEIGSHKLSRYFVQTLKNAGVLIHSFHTTKGKGNRLQVNFRNHRKLAIIDGQIGFMGGLNWADEYRGLVERVNGWRDTFIQIKGPVLTQLQITFWRDWHWATGEVPNLVWAPELQSQNQTCLIMPSGPNNTLPTVMHMLTQMIHSAKKRIWITSPYFVTEATLLNALTVAASKGVDVRILLPCEPDHRTIYLCGFSYHDYLSHTDIKLYAHHHGFMHEKAWLMDDQLAALGTANLDYRSMRLNFELMTFMASPENITAVSDMLEQDFANSKLIDTHLFKHRSYLFRLLVRTIRLSAPIL